MKNLCHNYLIIILIFFLPVTLCAQENASKNYEVRPFQVSFITPIGTNGVKSGDIVNNLSLNILAGYNAGVDGFEAGGFLNINRDYMYGAQLAGFGNINGGKTEGVQLSGFINVNGGITNGFQAAGFANINGNSNELVQLAGFLNATNNIDGIQGAGFLNIAENVDAMQISGFMNLAEKVDGVQLGGFINTADRIDGLQLAGFINVAGKVDGAQLAGFINICDSIDGIPVAPLSIVRKNGYRKLQVWSNETFYFNTSYKIGVRAFYTTVTGGFKPGKGKYNWAIGAGFGTNILIDERKSVDLEGLHYHIVRKKFWDPEYNQGYFYNSLNQIKLSFNYRMNVHAEIFAGPTFNILTIRNTEINNEITPSWAFDLWNSTNDVKAWFGFNAGLKF